MAEPLRIALAGLGTVGTGVIRLLDENRALVARRAGRPIVITAITARERSKDRGVDLTPYRWVDDMGELATADDVDVVVELVGGSDGPALTLARETLGATLPMCSPTHKPKAMLRRTRRSTLTELMPHTSFRSLPL